jgi:hypothetical protein
MILIPILWKQDLRNEVYVEKMAMAPQGWHAWCSPASTSTFIFKILGIWINFLLSICVKDLVIVLDLWDKFIHV